MLDTYFLKLQTGGVGCVWMVLSLLICGQAQASSTELDTLVSRSAEQQAVYDLAQPATVINKEQLDTQTDRTLGALLDDVAGVANASFGAGVGRPVIRGMSGNRIKILQSGSDTSDVSAMSSDHAPMTEASFAEQIEILSGPSALMYGSGAIGGVVNLIDRRIHEQPISGLQGDVSVRSTSVDAGHRTEAVLDAGAGNWVLHLDGFTRDAGNYRSGKESAPLESNAGRIANSDNQGEGGALALSWANGEHGFIGASISRLNYDYGVPNTEGEAFRVTPKQTRYDLKSAWWPALDGKWRWLEEWRTELSFNDYQHAEREPDVEVGLFEQQSWEMQSRIRHQRLGQWQGSVGVQIKQQQLALCHDHHGCSEIPSYKANWDGQQGSSLVALPEKNGYAFAHATPMPLTETQQLGLFIVEQRDWQRGTLEFGARMDRVTLSADPESIALNYRQERAYYDDKTFSPLTLSAAATWVWSEQQRLGLSVARVQRAPDAFELYWNGDHHATFSFQLDNADLTVETAYTLDLNWLYQGEQTQLRTALYYYQFDDYIYNQRQAFTDPLHDEQVYRHAQAAARFYGAEINWQRHVSHAWRLDLVADWVRARLLDGGAVPRTPPASLLLALNWQTNGLSARMEAKGVMAQREVASYEDSTDGVLLLNASTSYVQPLRHGELHWLASLHNLTDAYWLNHLSYLKEAAPMSGRSLQLALRYRF